MLFSSMTFLYFFLPVTFVIYFVVPQKWKNVLLLIASFLFYFWGEPKYCLLMGITILLGYAGGRQIAYCESDKKLCKLAVWIYSGVIIALLLFFKYGDFLLESVAGVMGADIPLLKIALPIGISFYTFQILSYLMDVYKKEVSAERNLIDFAAYVSMFPQLIAGPIVRFSKIQKELKERHISVQNVAEGCQRFVFGLGKKVLIADGLGELVSALDGVTDKSAGIYWVIAIAYTLQIYYDFSGYSDMAIGLGGILGFHFPENFNYPYISKSITEFWRRWHMTLGTWFRDYVYIPLGGNRTGTFRGKKVSRGVAFSRWIFNIAVVWFLSGLWHGASWNYVVWGLYFGVLLVLEKLFLKKVLNRLPQIFGHLYTMILVILSFVVFRLEDFSVAGIYLKGMFGVGASKVADSYGWYEVKSYMFLLLIAILGATPLAKWLVGKMRKSVAGNGIVQMMQPVVMVGMLLIVTAFLIQSSVHPFLYFRF